MNPKTTAVLSIVWLLFFAVALTLLFALAPIHLQTIPGDWRITAAAPALPDALSYSALVNIILGVRYVVLALFLCASGLIVLIRPNNWSGWLAAFVFLFLPFAFNLAGYTEQWPYPAPWKQVLDILRTLALFIGIVGFGLLVYVFPDGKFRPRWSRWFAGGAFVLIIGWILASQFIEDDDSSIVWILGMIIFLSLFLGGLISQVLRYRAADLEGRRLNRGFVIALSLFLFWMLESVLTGSLIIPALSMMNLFLELIMVTSLPVAVISTLLKYGLWRAPGEMNVRVVRSYFAVWAAVLVVGLAVLLLSGDRLLSVSAQPAGDLTWDKAPIPVIVDTDLSMDDHLAVLFLLQHPGVEIKAITVSGTGEVHCQAGVRNMLDILESVQAPEIPVTCGRETPLTGNLAFPDEWRQGADTLYGVVLPQGTRQPYAGSAVELLRSVLEQAAEPVTLITLGPLTNPGEALQASPELAGKIERIFIMGGAVNAPGNVGLSGVGIDNQTAEWNVYVDPLSTNLVLQAGAPVTFVPLDATNYAPVTMQFLGRLEGNRDTPAAQLAYDLMSARREVILSGGASFWDVLTAAIVLDGSLASYKIDGIVVQEADGPDIGQTRLDPGGPKASYAVWADGPRFEEQFLQALNHP